MALDRVSAGRSGLAYHHAAIMAWRMLVLTMPVDANLRSRPLRVFIS